MVAVEGVHLATPALDVAGQILRQPAGVDDEADALLLPTALPRGAHGNVQLLLDRFGRGRNAGVAEVGLAIDIAQWLELVG